MNMNDRRDFYEVMTKSFGDYGKTAPVEMMEEWFEDLSDYSFFQLRGAFRAYKLENIYAPVIASIRKYANRISRESSTKVQNCQKMNGRSICGSVVFVHGLCEKCYDATRPKSFVDEMREKYLREFYERGKASDCKTPRDFANFARREMSMLPLGQVVLKHVSESFIKGHVGRSDEVVATHA